MKLILYIFCLLIFIAILWRALSMYFTLPCPSWLGWLVERDNPFFTINRSETIIHHLNLKAGMIVLDVGCGPGRLTIPVAKAVGPTGEVVAMDIQTGMLEKVQKKAHDAQLKNITLLHANIRETHLQKNMFDRVLLVTVLGEIPHQEVALKQIFDVLKPGGILSVTEIICDPHFQRRGTVIHLAQRVGFHTNEMFGNCVAFTINLEKPISD